jgi:DNA (cytosine-5)-methyltransferase 3A
MSNSIKETISSRLNSQPLQINGALVSAAERDRYYWTNILNVKQPKDRGLVLKDILQDDVPEKYYYTYNNKGVKCDWIINNPNKAQCGVFTQGISGHDILKRIYNINFKCATLTTCSGGNTQKKILDGDRVRKLTPLEYERCMTLPDNYTGCVTDTNRYNGCGNGWVAKIIRHILSCIPYNNEPIEFLSMYDGIATGRYVADILDFNVVKYKAYEIDKYAIQVANNNYPDIIQCGDAFQVREDGWKY